jgi:hypothetical protein
MTPPTPLSPLSRSLARSSPDNGTPGYRRSLGYRRHRSKHHALPGAIDLSVDMQWVGPVQRGGGSARPVDEGQCVPGFQRWTLHGSRLLRVASSDTSSDYSTAYKGSDHKTAYKGSDYRSSHTSTSEYAFMGSYGSANRRAD